MRLRDEPRNLATITWKHVVSGERPIGFAANADGDIVILCGEDDHGDDTDENSAVGLGHLTDAEPLILEIDWLPKGFEAVLTGARRWEMQPIRDEGDET